MIWWLALFWVALIFAAVTLFLWAAEMLYRMKLKDYPKDESSADIL